MKCCLCEKDVEATLDDKGNIIGTFGHNPDPVLVPENGERCCEYCHYHKVIPKRILDLYSTKSKGKKSDNEKE